MKINLMPHTPFLKQDGTFNKDQALVLSGHIAGVCYSKDGYQVLKQESIDKTQRRINMTLESDHHSVYEHINIGLELIDIPKILAMFLNNEKQYTTSEKSLRYTPVTECDQISDLEVELYNKWLDIFNLEITKKYGTVFNETKINKLAQENARYMVSVFMPTKMIHTIPFAQLNKIVAFMKKSQASKNEIYIKMQPYFKEFIDLIGQLNLLEPSLQTNQKFRDFSLISNDKVEESFGNTYSTNYLGSFAQFGQVQRHRTINYSFDLLNESLYYVPEILRYDANLVKAWLSDIQSVSLVHPQGELISINEIGTYEAFIGKCKERLCSHAQLEVNNQTKKTLERYAQTLIQNEHPLAIDVNKYMNGARCTFPDFICTDKCHFSEGVKLVRRI